MERLTKYDTDGQAMMDCQKCEADWTGKHGKPMVDCTALYCRNRLKDRLAAYEETELTPEEVLSMKFEWCAMMDALNSRRKKVNPVRPSDVAPVVHGRWMEHYRSGVTVAEGGVSSCCDMWNDRRSNYCPNCGAKMDGGVDHEAD